MTKNNDFTHVIKNSCSSASVT